ncbi:MAG TPA: hypothetical protein PK186_06205 [candidate division Zixibacteria bacterium]|nr:hypothetical protein [candidate division Zixibacteria bacterium]MDD4918522.1 hypothetical protein [candidate division Zixibacteria bacterium]MDM7973392.1 hypothetical protein [candidate division Zixibacteria bacterium]HPM37135.1 hypothetical protein [candidate division Zixibacteria bacterium]
MGKTFTCILLLAAVVSAAAGAQAGTYVSLLGDFYFDYPEGWLQLDHKLVDAYLMQGKAGEPILAYEAAFSPTYQVPFFTGPYFILTVDTVSGGYSPAQVDSIVADMGRRYGKEVRYFPVADFLADLKSNSPSYDAATRTITVASDIVERGEILKRHLLVEKFFDRGVATFYFYAPDSVFSDAERIFNGVLASFHSGGAAEKLPRETLRVADIKTEDAGRSDQASGSLRWIAWLALILAAALIVIRLLVRKSRRP